MVQTPIVVAFSSVLIVIALAGAAAALLFTDEGRRRDGYRVLSLSIMLLTGVTGLFSVLG